MEKLGGEPKGVAEASHLGLGRVGAASPWRQHLKAPLESLTGACVHMCMYSGPCAHTQGPQSPRNPGSSQKPLNNRCHTLEGVGAMESVSRVGKGTGAQKDQQGRGSSVPPVTSGAQRAEAQSSTPITHPTGVPCSPILG